MPSWDPAQYAQFAAERARPCRDLIAAIAVESPERIADLGCGSGNSAAMLAERWPAAQILGIDTSSEMLEAARATNQRASFEQAEIEEWARHPGEWEVVFSNAALQWVPHHESVFPQLMQRVSPGGALAVQMPADMHAPAHIIARELAASPAWSTRFATSPSSWQVHSAGFYYDALSPHAKRLDLWMTDYFHALPSAESITEWYRGSGLRPYIDALRTLSARTEFLAQYTDRLRSEYPSRRDGRVLLPFSRIFVVAYR
jgi:trans-aconitate 2-methyltransferase